MIYKLHNRLEAFIFKSDFDYTDQWMMISAGIVVIALLIGIAVIIRGKNS